MTQEMPIAALPGRTSVASILDRVSCDTGLPRAAIRGRERTARMCSARAAVIWLAQQLTRLSSSQIGRQLGRDHSTILYAARKAVALREEDADFRGMTDRILNHFRDIQED